MDDQESLQISELNGSTIFKNRRASSKTKSQGNYNIFLIFIIAAGIILFLFMALKLFQFQKRLTHIESGPVKTAYAESTAVAPSLSVANTDSTKINELELKVQRLSQLVDKLQSQLKEPKAATAINFTNITSATLIEHIQRRFASQKVTINFLHMHSREVFYYDKIEFLRSVLGTDLLRTNEKAKVSFMQAFANFKLPHSNVHIQNEINDWHKKEKERLSREYDFGMKELPFCIVVPTLNNAKGFRYQYNLQSMVNLDYQNFKIVIVDDASTDYTYQLIKQWIEENQIKHNIAVITNEKRMTAVPNIHRAIVDHCGPDDIVVLADGDDEILGRYSLKVFNHLYQKNNADVVYSNHLQFYTHAKQVYRGWSMNYGDDEKKNNRYRDVPQKIAHLRSFKAKLYRLIKEADLKDEKGEWLTSTYDQVICLPILEMSCGRIVYVDEFFYLYNFGIGTNDLQVDPGLQKSIADYVKFKKPKYQCVNQ